MPLLDKLRAVRGSDRYAANCILPRQRITTVNNSDIIRINAVPVRSDDWLKKEIQRVYDENHQVYGVRKSGVSCYGKVSEWPDALWHVSWRLWDLPVFSGGKRSVRPSAGKPLPQAIA